MDWTKGHHPDFPTFYPCWVYDAGENVALARWEGERWSGARFNYHVWNCDVVAWRMMEMPPPPTLQADDWLDAPPPYYSMGDWCYIWDGRYVTLSRWKKNTWRVGGFAFAPADVTHYQRVTTVEAPKLGPIWAAERRVAKREKEL